MTTLPHITKGLGRMNYTQRLMLAIGSYTFMIMLIFMLGVWAFIEYSETDDTQEIAQSMHSALVLLNQAPFTPSSLPIHTDNFDLYLSAEQLPASLQKQAIKPGFTRLASGSALMMEINPNTQAPYYLVFNSEGTGNLIETEFDDILFVLAAVIVSTLLTLLMVRRMAKSLATPVITLKEQVEAFDISQNNFPRMDRDDEIGQLNHAFGDLIQRMHQFTKREQDFTRFASHELRSPITVIRGNLDILQESLPDSPVHHRIVKRMNTAIQRVSLLIDGFLWLGRENNDTSIPAETLHTEQLTELVNGLIQHQSPENQARLTCNISDIHWQVRPLMVSILLDNLLRNALLHSDQPVALIAHGKHLQVSNSIGSPTDAEQLGIGLQIVNRICDANHWAYKIDQGERHFSFSVELS